jgi:hypothetical protein
MKVRSKKVLSAAVVSAILAAQTLMPVAAAGGTIDADMSTKSPILRVAVPTKMAVSVNEFEMGDTGSQITSGEFTMKNMSEIPVNVKVTSQATVGADTTLVSSKQAAKDSTDTAKPAMWLAAVAAVAETSGTLEYTTESDKTVNGLEGTEGNITAFGTKDENNESEVIQNFYLQAATNATFKGITGAEVDAEKTAATATVGGADFYELTALSNAGDDAAGAAALAADKDIYINSTAPAGGAPVTLTKVAKGTAAGSITWTAGDKAYAIADAPTAAASLINTKSYLYIDNATTAAGDAAAFRYIGALSEAKSGWSTTDLSGITLTYDIIGISGSAYDGIAGADGKGLTYGYKKEDAVITLDTTGMITMNTTTAQLSALYVNDGASDILMNSTKGSWGDTWNDTSTVLKFQLNETWVNYAKGKTIVAKLVLKDGTTYESTAVVFPE